MLSPEERLERRRAAGNKLGWSTDHDHATGKVRGILCHGCNQALGGAKDDPKTLRALAEYLEKQAAA